MYFIKKNLYKGFTIATSNVGNVIARKGAITFCGKNVEDVKSAIDGYFR